MPSLTLPCTQSYLALHLYPDLDIDPDHAFEPNTYFDRLTDPNLHLYLMLVPDEPDINTLLDICGVIARGDRTKITMSLGVMKQLKVRYVNSVCT